MPGNAIKDKKVKLTPREEKYFAYWILSGIGSMPIGMLLAFFFLPDSYSYGNWNIFFKAYIGAAYGFVAFLALTLITLFASALLCICSHVFNVAVKKKTNCQ